MGLIRPGQSRRRLPSAAGIHPTRRGLVAAILRQNRKHTNGCSCHFLNPAFASLQCEPPAQRVVDGAQVECGQSANGATDSLPPKRIQFVDHDLRWLIEAIAFVRSDDDTEEPQPRQVGGQGTNSNRCVMFHEGTCLHDDNGPWFSKIPGYNRSDQISASPVHAPAKSRSTIWSQAESGASSFAAI
jgi:hypothetical protein